MAKSNLEITITAKDQASKNLKKLDKGLEGVNKEVKKSSAGFKSMGMDLLKMGAVVGGVTAGLVLAGKALFDLGERGAIVEQTGESFDFLIEKLELTPDLLEQLDRAALGTIDNMTLMSSVSTLLAGTSQELGMELGKNTPRLLEIAKAANKLNPSLGSTAQLFTDIATGVKRASPMILDNLGLTISLGQANEEYAEALGKTVEQLTEEEKKLALLNATMKAGDKLIAQVGGNLDALTDSYARNQAMLKNLTDEMSTKAQPAIGRIVERLNELLPPLLDWLEIIPGVDDALKDHIITLEDYEVIMGMAVHGEEGMALATDYLQLKIDQYNERMLDANEVTDGWVNGLGDLRIGLDEVSGATEGAQMSAEEYAKHLERINKASADAITNLRELTQIKIDEFFDVDLGVGGVAARMFDITHFKEFGGEALEIMVQEVQAGLAEGKITGDQAREFFKNISIEAEAIKVKMGEIDAEQAAESIAKDFNIPIKESRELVDSVLEGIDLVNSADISTIIDAFDDLQERKEELMEAGEFDLEADPRDEAQIVLDGLQEQVDILTGETWLIEFKIVTTGEIPSGGGGGIHPDFIAPGAQHGVDYVVPSGFPNDSLYQPVSSGEHVSVTPAGQKGGGDTFTQNVTQHFYDEGAAALGLAVVRENGRSRLNASMGR